MNSSFLMCLSSSDEEETCVASIRKELRDRSDPLSLPAMSFKSRYRVTKEAFNYILFNLKFPEHMSTAVPPKLQLAATLSLLASGSFQHCVGNDYLVGIGQSTVSRIISHVVDEMKTKLCPKFIKFDPKESSACMDYFLNKYNIPGVIGCIDGTHIGLQRPTKNEHMFFNRKDFHSLNAMVICDHNHKILSVNSKYGGSAHDSFVWRHSDEKRMLEHLFQETNLKNSWLLGDSGYPLEPWLITPFRNIDEGSMEAYFNEIHSKGRSIVERTIGILKARWKILSNEKRSRYSPEKIARFINVCVALHNVCIYFKVPNYTQTLVSESVPPDPDVGNETQLTKIGQRIRDHIKLSLWRNK